MRFGTRVALAIFALMLFAGFVSLGTWQVERRSWKLDLIERVEQRAHARPVAAPDEPAWPSVTAANDEYRRVALSGTFLHEKEALVQASTELGAGFWVITPLQRQNGTIVLVNRGYVPEARRARDTRVAFEPLGETSVTGLLRITEPEGGFLRQNDPQADRWFSRDVAAIAQSRGLSRVAPYFVDAQPAAVAGDRAPRPWPVAGLTVISFHNSHAVYAITWYILALMVVAAALLVVRHERRRHS